MMTNYSAMMMSAYPILLDLMVRLVESQSGKPISPGEAWRNDAQTLSLKLFRHLVSMQTLSNGATVNCSNGLKLSHIDHGSVIVVTRAAVETYLVWHYIYGQSDRALAHFRYMTWRLAGLMERQNHHIVLPEAIVKRNAEKPFVDKLRADILASKFFGAFSSRQQKKILDGDWKIAVSTGDLAVSAGIHGTYFKNMYGYLCSYSHASYVSAMQTGEAKDLEELVQLTRAILGIGVVVMAHFACNYPNQFPEAAAVFAADSEAKAVAEKWAFTADDMAATYGDVQTRDLEA